MMVVCSRLPHGGIGCVALITVPISQPAVFCCCQCCQVWVVFVGECRSLNFPCLCHPNQMLVVCFGLPRGGIGWVALIAVPISQPVAFFVASAAKCGWLLCVNIEVSTPHAYAIPIRCWWFVMGHRMEESIVLH